MMDAINKHKVVSNNSLVERAVAVGDGGITGGRRSNGGGAVVLVC